jgi:Ca2+:H+ antiporter
MTRRESIVVPLVGVATAAAGIAHYAGVTALLAFALATAALAGLAWVVAIATEQVGERFGPAVTGVLQSTLGNLPEFFVVVFALRAGETVVAQTSIVGSLFANALLVLGLAVVAGARRAEDGVMRFGARLPRDTATLLLLASFLVVLIGISTAANDRASRHVTAISVVGAIVLLTVYASWLLPYLRAGGEAQPGRVAPRAPLRVAVALLAAGGIGSAFVSDWFVAALTPTIDRLSLSQAFAGIVVVAIAGNAVENVAGVALAAKGEADLAISVIKNSVAQIIAFLYPALVLVSLLFAHTLTFGLRPVFVGAVLLTALAVWQVTGDGEASEFEGWALVGIYVMLGALALYE